MRLINQEINRFENQTEKSFVFNNDLFDEKSPYDFTNTFDKWILAWVQDILGFVHEEFSNYRLYTVLKKQLSFLHDLSNWYVNMNKSRFKGSVSVEDTENALNVLIYAFMNCIISMAPYVPFIVEYFYFDLQKIMREGSSWKQQSIHLLDMPLPNKAF